MFFLLFCRIVLLRNYISATVNNETLQYVNWFIPIDDFIVIGQAWLVAIGIFYLYQIVLRWLKVIGS